MKSRKERIVIIALLSLVMLVSCGPNAADRPGQPTGDEPPGAISDEAAEQDLLAHPLLSLIEVDPPVSAPGSQVMLHSDPWVTGELTITAPSGEVINAEMTEGSSQVSLSSDSLEGLYLIVLNSDDGPVAFGSLRVARDPGVWVTADRTYTNTDQPTVLTVTTLDIPAEAVAAVYLGQLTDGNARPLVPNEEGLLLPGDPIRAADLTDRSLRLPSGYQGTIQVGIQEANQATQTGINYADETNLSKDPPPNFNGWISNAITLRACEQPGEVRGDLGEEGFVNLIWTDGNLQSTSTYTAIGPFSLEAGPGKVLVQTFNMEGEPLGEPVGNFVEVGCGESIEWALATSASSHVASLAPFGSQSRIPQRIRSNVVHSAVQRQASAGGGEACRTGIVVPTVSDADGVNPRHSVLAGIALKTTMNEAASEAKVSSLSDAHALIEAIAQAQLMGADEEDWSALLESLQSMVSSDFVISLTAARMGQRYGVSAAALPTLPGDAQVRASGQGNPGALFDSTFSVYTDLAEKFRQAAICGSAEPERAQITMDEKLAIRYTVTDLAGEGADVASVLISSPACGKLDPEGGSIDGDLFETGFEYHTEEYCAEELEFKAEWSGSQGAVKTRPEETLVQISPQLPELTLRAGAAAGIGNTASLATAITLYEDYDVRDQPGSLAALTQDAECGFLEGGLELEDQYFYARSESSGKRAESVLMVYTSADEEGARADDPVDRVLVRIELDTWAIEIEDDNVIRGSWASGANHSDPNLTRTPGTLLVFDVQNPGNLPTTPIVSWQLGGTIDDASSHSVLVFYKVIECGEDPGIGSLFEFVADGDILLESDNENAGPPTGIIPLAEFDGDRQQIIMWVTSLLTTASIRDDDAGADIGGRASLNFQLSVNLAQELR